MSALVTDLFGNVDERGAALSDDGRYRYRLWRRWAHAPTVTWIMLNPSTADADQDDPTIRRCIRFARRWGAGGIEVVNVYAWRATDPKELAYADDPVGPENDSHLFDTVMWSSTVVAAWGAHPGATAAFDRFLGHHPSVRPGGIISALGTTKEGHPRHPLYVRADRPLERWR